MALLWRSLQAGVPLTKVWGPLEGCLEEVELHLKGEVGVSW